MLVEKHSEDVFGVEVVSEEMSLGAEVLPVLILVAELVIMTAFLSVRETCKGLRQLLEGICGLGTPVFVWVQLQSQLFNSSLMLEITFLYARLMSSSPAFFSTPKIL